jgi:hypothetical protein
MTAAVYCLLSTALTTNARWRIQVAIAQSKQTWAVQSIKPMHSFDHDLSALSIPNLAQVNYRR